MNIFSTLLNSIKAKIMPLVTRARMWFSPNFWKAQGNVMLRKFFSKVLDVRPRDKTDYYSIARWLVSKRLAFAITIGLAVVCLLYVSTVVPDGMMNFGGGKLKTYKYSALPLKFLETDVNIKAHDGYIAYTGGVAKGYAAGKGTLYDPDGNVIYIGDFDKSMYNGEGTLYYTDGTTEYEGAFKDNLFDGTGTFYRNTAVKQYEGNWSRSKRDGTGTLYDTAGNAVYTGTWSNDRLVYEELLGKTTEEFAEQYTGSVHVYSTEDEYAVEASDIEAVYSVSSGEESVTDSWIVNRLLVRSDTIYAAGNELTSIQQLTEFFGEPSYFGLTYVTLDEAVMINALSAAGNGSMGYVDIDGTDTFDEVTTVNDYDFGYEVYMYTYEYAKVLYSVYCMKAGETEFSMYCIELAE